MPKVNVIARLEYELTYYDSAVHRFNHNTTRTSQYIYVYIYREIESERWRETERIYRENIKIERKIYIKRERKPLCVCVCVCVCVWLYVCLHNSCIYIHAVWRSEADPLTLHDFKWQILNNQFRCQKKDRVKFYVISIYLFKFFIFLFFDIFFLKDAAEVILQS